MNHDAPPSSQTSRSMTPSTPLWILAVFIGGWILREASTVFIWILSSFFLFALLDPWMQRLVRKGISPVISAIGLISLVTIGCAVGATALYRFSSDIGEDFNSYRTTVIHIYDSASNTMIHELHELSRSGNDMGLVHEPPVSPVSEDKSPISGDFGASLLRGLGTAFTAIVFALLCPILTFFMIAERKALASVIGRRFADQKRGEAMWQKVTQTTGAFFLGNLVICFLSFPVFCALFRAFGVSTPYALAAAASILNLVPFLGAALSGLLPVLNLLSSQAASPTLAIALVLTCILIHFTVANFVTPKVLGSKVDLNATTSTIALIVWGELLGGMGLLLAIPITASIKIAFQYSRSPELHWLGLLMSDDSESLLNQANRQFSINLNSVNKLSSALGIATANPSKSTPSDLASKEDSIEPGE